MSVADILQQMSQTVGRQARERGAIWGNVIESASNVPGQILADRERHALLLRQQAQQDATAGYARNADARATKDQELQDAAAQRALDHKALINKALTAARPGGDPNQFDSQAALATLTSGGEPDALKEVWAAHQSTRPVVTQQDPTKDTYEDGVLKKPGVAKPPPPSPAGFAAIMNDPTKTPEERAAAKLSLDAVQQTPGQEETVRHNQEMEKIGRMTAGREVAAQQETARHNRATETAANPLGPGGAALSGAELLAKLSPDQRAQAQGLVDGRRSLDARLAATPNGRSIISGAYALDPTFDQGNYNARNKARSDFASPNGAGGKIVNSLNTAIQHAGKLSDLVEALDNFDIPKANVVANWWNKETGGTKVTNFEAVQPQMMKEIERLWRGSGGSQGDIDALKASLGSNLGRQQQREALEQFVGLMEGKLQSTEQQRDAVMGAKAGADIPIIFEPNKSVLAQIKARASGQVAPEPAAAAPAVTVGAIVTVKGQKVRVTAIGPNGQLQGVPVP